MKDTKQVIDADDFNADWLRHLEPKTNSGKKSVTIRLGDLVYNGRLVELAHQEQGQKS